MKSVEPAHIKMLLGPDRSPPTSDFTLPRDAACALTSWNYFMRAEFSSFAEFRELWEYQDLKDGYAQLIQAES
jgi:hypothetical protein